MPAVRAWLVQVSPELGGHYTDVAAAGDVVLYGGLTALASFERGELKCSIVENTGFRELLELNPDVRPHPLPTLRHSLHGLRRPQGGSCMVILSVRIPITATAGGATHAEHAWDGCVRMCCMQLRSSSCPVIYPAQVREVVYDFFGSRYASCLARLQRLLPLLRLDMHLAPHLDALHAAVRCRPLAASLEPDGVARVFSKSLRLSVLHVLEVYTVRRACGCML